MARAIKPGSSHRYMCMHERISRTNVKKIYFGIWKRHVVHAPATKIYMLPPIRVPLTHLTLWSRLCVCDLPLVDLRSLCIHARIKYFMTHFDRGAMFIPAKIQLPPMPVRMRCIISNGKRNKISRRIKYQN